MEAWTRGGFLCLHDILGCLTSAELCVSAQCCHSWVDCSQHNSLWRRLLFARWPAPVPGQDPSPASLRLVYKQRHKAEWCNSPYRDATIRGQQQPCFSFVVDGRVADRLVFSGSAAIQANERADDPQSAAASNVIVGAQRFVSAWEIRSQLRVTLTIVRNLDGAIICLDSRCALEDGVAWFYLVRSPEISRDVLIGVHLASVSCLHSPRSLEELLQEGMLHQGIHSLDEASLRFYAEQGPGDWEPFDCEIAQELFTDRDINWVVVGSSTEVNS